MLNLNFLDLNGIFFIKIIFYEYTFTINKIFLNLGANIMTSIEIKKVTHDKNTSHLALVEFFDKEQKTSFFARMDLAKFWFIDPVRFEQEVDVNKKIASLLS